MRRCHHLASKSSSSAVSYFSTAAAKDTPKPSEAAAPTDFSNKKGRGWTDPWDLTELMTSKIEFDDLPDWSPSLVSRVSQERLQVRPIMNLAELANLETVKPQPHAATQTKLYALYRKRAQYKYIRQQVQTLAAPKIAGIQALESWQDKQDAVDELYEEIEFQLQQKESVLGKHPMFGTWIERALEDYLKSLATADAASTEIEETVTPTPVFMDCFQPGTDDESKTVPRVLSPLTTKPDGDAAGDMVEEWQLSAHPSSRRILVRKVTQQVAQALLEPSQKILLSGVHGVGKTAAIAAIVAAARHSENTVVAYMPHGDQYHRHGYYVEPNPHRKGVFDLPILSQRAIESLCESHGEDFKDHSLPKDLLEEFFTPDQVERLLRGQEKDQSIPLSDLLKFGQDRAAYAGSSWAAAMEYLLHYQDSTNFVLVMDEVNCYYIPKGHYFHGDFDSEVRKSIPYEQISLFAPGLQNLKQDPAKPLQSKSSILVATTESHAVPRSVTEKCLQDMHVTHHLVVPRLTPEEVDHMLSNYEATGVGKLRLDRGETVMNPQEVAYLRMVSGDIPLHLMNACIL